MDQMQRLLAFSVLYLFIACPGCADTREKLASENLSVMKELNAVLDGIKDEASAASAKSKLKSLMEKMADLNQRESKLPAPTKQEIDTLQTKYSKEMEEVAHKFQANIMRIQFDPKLNSVFTDLNETMAKIKR
jgi:hypothetical protein